MIGTRELCIMLLGGSLGVGGAVGVQKVSPGRETVRAKQGQPEARAAGRARPVRVTPAPAAPVMLDCPAPGPFTAEPVPLAPIPGLEPGGGGGTPWPPPPGGGGGNPAAPSIPEPAQWALLLAGFGLVGVAARRKALGGTDGR